MNEDEEIRPPGWGHPVFLLAIAWAAVAAWLLWWVLCGTTP